MKKLENLGVKKCIVNKGGTFVVMYFVVVKEGILVVKNFVVQ